MRNANHPRKGDTIKVQPIRDLTAISRLKQKLAPSPRDYCLFVMGVNTNLRASDLLPITIGQVKYCGVGDLFTLKEKKTGKVRQITMNSAVFEAVQALLATRPNAPDQAPLFPSRKTRKPLTVPALNKMVKEWCRELGLRENYGSHTLRKTFGYVHRKVHGTDVPTLMRMFNHSSQKETLEYLGIQPDEIATAYLKVV